VYEREYNLYQRNLGAFFFNHVQFHIFSEFGCRDSLFSLSVQNITEFEIIVQNFIPPSCFDHEMIGMQ